MQSISRRRHTSARVRQAEKSWAQPVAMAAPNTPRSSAITNRQASPRVSTDDTASTTMGVRESPWARNTAEPML